MLSRSHIKINIAVLIFVAFLFRMLFVNLCLFTSLNSNDGNGLVDSHFSSILKKRRRADVQNKAAFEIGSSEVVCEESSGNEEDDAKIHAPAVLSWFHSVVKEFISAFAGNKPIDAIRCDLRSRRYLALSVLRI